jgi:hypothetical protein
MFDQGKAKMGPKAQCLPTNGIYWVYGEAAWLILK